MYCEGCGTEMWGRASWCERCHDGATEIDNLEAKLSVLRYAIQSAVNDECSCGGSGPGAGCQACEVWHNVKAMVPDGWRL